MGGYIGKGKSVTQVDGYNRTEADAEFATAAQGTLAGSAVQPSDNATLGNVSVTSLAVTGNVDGRDVSADGTKLDGIETSATADQTAAQIKTAYESNADTNEFSDAEQTKLAGIETAADVTDATNVTAAGALMDSEVTNLAQVKAFSSADYATAAQGALGASALQPDGDGSQLTGISGSATDIVAFSTDPSVGSAGKIYYNTTTKVLRTSDGTAWTNVSNAAPQPSGGTIALTSTNEGDAFSYDLGADFTDDREGDTALTYALASGTLPSGLSVPSSGSSTLAGTLGQVAANTAYAFAITATDADGLTSSPQSYTMTIIHVPFSASGGTETTSGGYKYHTFTSSGTLVGSGGSGSVEYLVVAGGGGSSGGGGGAGGLRSGTASVSANSYSVVVGAGGGSATAAGTNQSAGSNSSALSITSNGGGRGSTRTLTAGSGGSGGGGGHDNTSAGGSGTSGQGNSGGAGRAGPFGTGGGGGGATQAGSSGGRGNPSTGGAGGNGSNAYSSWATATSTGSSGYYAGGGGGGSSTDAGAPGASTAGLGGGGIGSNADGSSGSGGAQNTGGGAGGSEWHGGPSGSGGSGIVIIRYAV